MRNFFKLFSLVAAAVIGFIAFGQSTAMAQGARVTCVIRDPGTNEIVRRQVVDSPSICNAMRRSNENRYFDQRRPSYDVYQRQQIVRRDGYRHGPAYRQPHPRRVYRLAPPRRNHLSPRYRYRNHRSGASAETIIGAGVGAAVGAWIGGEVGRH
ncbi:hypothetical protein CL644_01665 [bacterium]|nr:hypothetical protein [bacterium]|tara:strand:+ start:2414 stop:2875 length:462 start_codon:yes stop_codon:yes gene_type:complete